jgi:signal transduction histidine kinase
VEDRGDAILVRLRDNGPGIDSSVKSRLFQPFVTSKADGTGLGLSFVKRVAEEMKGRVNAQNQLFSQGAQFEIELPKDSSRLLDMGTQRGLSG